MRKLILALVPALVSSAALAATPTTGMTCAQAQQVVAARGGVVLYTGRYTYDRYVANRSFCAATEITEPAWVPTRDVAQCYVGGTCKEPDPAQNDMFRN